MLSALVKWSTGKEKGTYTVIRADWIIDVDINSFDNRHEQSCVVEWRVPLKKNKSGSTSKWDIFDAVLIMISEKESELHKLRIARENDFLLDDGPEQKRPAKMPARFVDDNPCDEDKTRRTSKTAMQESSKKRVANLMAQIAAKRSATNASAAAESENVANLKRRMQELEAENLKLKTLVTQEMPTLMAEIKNVLKRCADKQQLSTETSLVTSDLPFTGLQSPSMITTTPRRSPRKCQQPTSTPLAPSSNSDRIPIFPGSDVLANRAAVGIAQQCATATAMARTLLLAVFDVETLLASNLKGGKSKRQFGEDQTPLKKLDEHKLDAIYSACMSKFPTVQRGFLGMAINGKLTEMRRKKSSATMDGDNSSD